MFFRFLIGSILLLSFSLVLPVFGAKKHNSKEPAISHDQELKNREYMIEISRQLGVTCNYCHNVKNFRDDSMKTWKVSREHMRIVDLLNNKGFTKGPTADCYMCHRAKAIPDYKESLSNSEQKHESPSHE